MNKRKHFYNHCIVFICMVLFCEDTLWVFKRQLVACSTEGVFSYCTIIMYVYIPSLGADDSGTLCKSRYIYEMEMLLYYTYE